MGEGGWGSGRDGGVRSERRWVGSFSMKFFAVFDCFSQMFKRALVCATYWWVTARCGCLLCSRACTRCVTSCSDVRPCVLVRDRALWLCRWACTRCMMCWMPSGSTTTCATTRTCGASSGRSRRCSSRTNGSS